MIISSGATCLSRRLQKKVSVPGQSHFHPENGVISGRTQFIQAIRSRWMRRSTESRSSSAAALFYPPERCSFGQIILHLSASQSEEYTVKLSFVRVAQIAFS